MTLRRAALYVGGGTLLVAWFSSAASLSLHRAPRVSPAAGDPAAVLTENLASEVQAQTSRLRQRLASAPVPQQPLRNPFAFEAVRPKGAPAASRRADASPVTPLSGDAPEPPLTLIGIAEHRQGAVPVRTAMIATAGEQLIMVVAGDPVLQRYRVAAVATDAVELVELSTGRTRRLHLP